MIQQMLILTCLFSLADGAEGQSPQEVLQAQAKAWNRGDIKGFMQHYWKSEKLTFISSGKITRGWKQTLARYQKRYATREKMGQLTFSELEVTKLSKDAALVLGRWHLKRKEDSPEGRFSLIFRRVEGRWVIIHDHTSSLEK